jgi:hypothetical protein
METLFLISNVYIIPFWVMMMAAPRWPWTKRIIGSPWIAAPLALLYVVLIIPQLGSLLGDLLNPSLMNIAAALSTPEGAMVGWVHFLTFDLFVGRWVYLDSQEKKLSPWLMAPVLFLILMMGPLGFSFYLVIRTVGRVAPSSQPLS